MHTYNAVLFDCYDVLVPDHDRLWREAHGLQSTSGYSELSACLNRGDISYHTFTTGLGKLSGQTPDEVTAELRSLAAPNAAVVAIVEASRQVAATGLVSNAHSDELRPLLAKHGLYACFDTVVISSELGCSKPDPAIFHHALARLACTVEEAIFVDDSALNTAAAAALGMQTITYNNPAQLSQELGGYIPALADLQLIEA